MVICKVLTFFLMKIFLETYGQCEYSLPFQRNGVFFIANHNLGCWIVEIWDPLISEQKIAEILDFLLSQRVSGEILKKFGKMKQEKAKISSNLLNKSWQHCHSKFFACTRIVIWYSVKDLSNANTSKNQEGIRFYIWKCAVCVPA